MSKPNTEATGKPTPIAGCMIFCVLIGMATFVAVFSTYQYKQYKKEIINISQQEQTKTTIASLEDKAAVDTFDQKMKDFEAAVKEGEKTELSLTAEELNLAIALYPKLASFRGEMSIREITDEAIIRRHLLPGTRRFRWHPLPQRQHDYGTRHRHGLCVPHRLRNFHCHWQPGTAKNDP